MARNPLPAVASEGLSAAEASDKSNRSHGTYCPDPDAQEDFAEAAELEALLVRTARSLFTLDPEPVTAQLSVAQIRICSLLMDGPRPVTEVSKELRLSVSAITQITARLERGGFLERTIPQHDRRLRLLQLTAMGATMMRNRQERRVRSVAAALARLSPGARSGVLAALRALLEASRAPEPEGRYGAPLSRGGGTTPASPNPESAP